MGEENGSDAGAGALFFLPRRGGEGLWEQGGLRLRSRERGEGGGGWRKKKLLTGGPRLLAGERERGGEVVAQVLGRLGPSKPKTRGERDR